MNLLDVLVVQLVVVRQRIFPPLQPVDHPLFCLGNLSGCPVFGVRVNRSIRLEEDHRHRHIAQHILARVLRHGTVGQTRQQLARFQLLETHRARPTAGRHSSAIGGGSDSTFPHSVPHDSCCVARPRETLSDRAGAPTGRSTRTAAGTRHDEPPTRHPVGSLGEHPCLAEAVVDKTAASSDPLDLLLIIVGEGETRKKMVQRGRQPGPLWPGPCRSYQLLCRPPTRGGEGGAISQARQPAARLYTSQDPNSESRASWSSAISLDNSSNRSSKSSLW